MSEARKEPVFGRTGDDSAQIQRHLIEHENSKERLQDQLADLLFQSSEDELDMDALDALLDALDQADPLPESKVLDTEESLAQFHAKYAPVFAAVEASSAATPAPVPDRKHSRYMLFKILPLAAALSLLLGSVAAQAFGFDIFGAIARWTSEVFHLSDTSVPYATIRKNPLAEGESASYDTLEDAMEAFGITEDIVPQWLPERFALTDVTAVNQPSGIFICADYVSKDGFFQIRYKQSNLSDFSILEIENSHTKTRAHENLDYYILSDLGRHKAFWRNGEFEGQMFGNVSEQELIKIIDSI